MGIKFYFISNPSMFIPLFNLLHSAFSVWDAKGLTSLCKEEWKIIFEVMTSVVPV